MSFYSENQEEEQGSWQQHQNTTTTTGSTTLLEIDTSNNNYATDLQIEAVEEEEEDDFDDDDNDSEYSLDYEFPGPHYANYRSTTNDNDQASDLSDLEQDLQDARPRFDMYDDDPYNDFTWESNDMQLTRSIKKLKRKQHLATRTFWRNEKGWPRQLPYSCSSTNHDQSANAICLVRSNYGLSEQLFAVYRDGIIRCGKPSPFVRQQHQQQSSYNLRNSRQLDSTCLDSDVQQQSSSSSSSNTADKFMDAHQSVSLSKYQHTTQPRSLILEKEEKQPYINQFKPYTKYIKRSDYLTSKEEAFLSLGFEPQCLAINYGYMAIGGVEGECELYCCMDTVPVKIWGTKFIGKDNVMLMTNAIQLVRWKNAQSGEYRHLLIGCINEAGLLLYYLPSHQLCTQQQEKTRPIVRLHSHLRAFHGVPINDAKLSPDGTKLVCVGDDKTIFMIDVTYHQDEIHFGTPVELVIPSRLLLPNLPPYSSQYVAWSPSSKYFAHTSDSHYLVFVWRRTTTTAEILYTIDAAGYTYAIAFHPLLDHILVFTNRYGYFHTVDLSRGTDGGSSTITNLLTFDHQTKFSRGHQCVDTCIQDEEEDFHLAVYHTKHLQLQQHEVTMVAFRGEINTRLRILAKINGIEWSQDGKYLYVATKKRVLAYQFSLTEDNVPSLFHITGTHMRKLLEEEVAQHDKKRKKFKNDIATSLIEQGERCDWSIHLPHDVRSRILGDTQQLACHW